MNAQLPSLRIFGVVTFTTMFILLCNYSFFILSDGYSQSCAFASAAESINYLIVGIARKVYTLIEQSHNTGVTVLLEYICLS